MSTVTRTAGKLKITSEEFGRMIEAGLYEGRHVELLDGELYEVTKNEPHNYAVDALAEALRGLLPRDRFRVREEKSVRPRKYWWPEPDISVLRGPKERYGRKLPGRKDILMVAEVCESSPQDRTVKLAGYARAGFASYWILDLNHRRLESYARPIRGRYAECGIAPEEGSVELVLEGESFGRIPVADLLPPEQARPAV